MNSTRGCKAPGVGIDLSPLYNFLRTGGNKQADGKQKWQTGWRGWRGATGTRPAADSISRAQSTRNHKATPWFAVRRTFCSSSPSVQGIESPLLAYLGRAKCSLIPNCIPCTQGCPRGLPSSLYVPFFPLFARPFRAIFTTRHRLLRRRHDFVEIAVIIRGTPAYFHNFIFYNDTNFFLFFSRFCYGMLDIFLIKTTFVLFAESLFVERGNSKEGGGRGTFVCFQYFIRMIIIWRLFDTFFFSLAFFNH